MFMAPDQACMEHNHSSGLVLSIQLGDHVLLPLQP